MTAKYDACSEGIWQGSITLHVQITESDVSSSEVPEAVFLAVNRLSYLPVALGDIVEYFRQHTIEFASDCWFECNGHPLPSNLPVGVLYDLFGERSRHMHILVHFQAFPTQTLLKCVTPEDSEHFYFHSLKQALFVLHGKTRAFNDLAVDQQQTLWQAVRCSERSLFESIGAKFRPALPVADYQQLMNLKSLPVRLLRRGKPVVQRPVSLWKASSTASLSTAVEKVRLSPVGGTSGGVAACTDGDIQTVGNSSAEDAAGSDTVNSVPRIAPDPEQVKKSLEDVIIQDFGAVLGVTDSDSCRSLEVVIQGITVPWEAPIYDVWRLMAHCDLFLYVVVL